MHSAATVLAFLQEKRGMLKPKYKFQALVVDADQGKNIDALEAKEKAELKPDVRSDEYPG